MQRLDPIDDGCGAVVPLVFKDENGAVTTPLTATWTLTDGDGNTINSRQDVEISSPSSTEYITLTAADTAYPDGDKRILVGEFTYTSSLTGGPVSGRAGCWFRVTDLPEGTE